MKFCIGIDRLTQKLQPLTLKINHHPLYTEIQSVQHLRLFMEQHVFAVWDFMCLLKELHCRIVTTSAPWFPPKDALSANLITSILVEEEGDIAEDGSYASHYDIYILAMKKIGANTQSIEKLLVLLREGVDINCALEQLSINEATKSFVQTTFSFFSLGLHEIAAAFVYGREGITSFMFAPLIKQLETEMNFRGQEQFSTLIYYFKRHVELDDEEHFPKALQMLSALVGNDEKKLQEVEAAAIRALTARYKFLTGIQKSLSPQNSTIL